MCDSIWSHYHNLEWSLRMRRVTWPITGGAKIIHIFEIHDPNFPIHFVTFRQLRRILSDFRPQKRPVKTVPIMAVFRKFKGLNIKYSYRDPQKALPYQERRLLTYFASKSVQGCRLTLGRPPPLQVGTRRLPWQHWFLINRATKSAFYDRIYQKCKGL